MAEFLNQPEDEPEDPIVAFGFAAMGKPYRGTGGGLRRRMYGTVDVANPRKRVVMI